MTRARFLPVLVGFAVGVLVPVLVALGARPAYATAPYSCVSNGDYGYITGYQNAGRTQDDQSAGTIGQVWSYTDAADCQRISSVYSVSQDTTARVEMGLFEGYDNCGDTTFHSNPIVFTAWHKTDGNGGCTIYTGKTPSRGAFHQFDVDDVTTATVFNYIYDGSLVGSKTMGFTVGWNSVGMERGNANDSGYAKFHGLLEYHPGNGFTNWDALTTWSAFTHDVDYHLQVLDGHDGDIVHN